MLDRDNTLNCLYNFEVIEYGFLGVGAATGVKFINNNKVALDDEHIQSKCIEIIENISLKDFIDYTLENTLKIRQFFEKVGEKNHDLLNRENLAYMEISRLRCTSLEMELPCVISEW